LTVVLNVLAAAEWGGEFEGVLDPISALFEFPALIELELFGIDLSINRTIIIAWLGTIFIAVLFVMGARKAEVIPGKFQAFLEMIVDVNRTIAMEIIGPKGAKFIPLLTTLFVTIFVLNFSKIFPLFMMPPTSRAAWPLFLALTSWLVFIGVGIKEQGFAGYFGGILFPPGVPKALYIILTPIELLSNLVLRPFTLAVRLFANMVAGHILVVITLVTIHVFLPSMPVGWTVGVFAFIAAPLVFAFELFIIGLQAYIFVMLTAVYISSSMEAHH
jgi:F-type H+-transporting ATPase subunit a